MSEEKDLDLRDKLAIEIFNGILSHSENAGSNRVIADIVNYLGYDDIGPEADRIRASAAKRIEEVIRACYKVSDIMRRVRLSAFE